MINLLVSTQYLRNKKRFPCLHSLIERREGLGEFETVMQNQDEVKGLHNIEKKRNSYMLRTLVPEACIGIISSCFAIFCHFAGFSHLKCQLKNWHGMFPKIF